jgi:hypothetical protein
MSSQTGIPTPIPVGSPHISKPPVFERWRPTSKLGDGEENRDYARRQLECDMWMIDSSSQSVLRCKTDDIGDAGIHATAPIGFGLAVGQRYEVRIASCQGRDGASPQLATSLGFATVIRAGIQVSNGKPDRVGFAVRFDVPQLIPV